jgi:hypothetical protein
MMAAVVFALHALVTTYYWLVCSMHTKRIARGRNNQAYYVDDEARQITNYVEIVSFGANHDLALVDPPFYIILQCNSLNR